jgi:hypothetical protein
MTTKLPERPMTQTEIAHDLYLDDETAWLEAMVQRIESGAYQELDYANLREFLSDMAVRERREVESRMRVLLTHILKWRFQPDHRTRSWKGSIIAQRQELISMASRGVLRNHADNVLLDVYRDAVEQASAETGLPANSFPAECEYSVDELLAFVPSSDPS